MHQTTSITVTLPSDLEIVLTRTFNSPRALVFKAHSSCDHVSRWWGQAGSTLSLCEMDFRTGGTWRFVEHDAAGDDHGFRGEFREIVQGEKIVQTFEYEGLPGHISVETLLFADEGSKTRLTSTSLFASVEDRDGMLQSGMETGANESWNRLAEYAESLS